MQCPETGGPCFDIDCQTMGCQGDGIRRQLNQMNVNGEDQDPIPRCIPRTALSANADDFDTQNVRFKYAERTRYLK